MGKSDVLIVGGVATVVTIGMINSCSRNREVQAVDQWRNSQGTQGFINLNAVKDAFRENQSLLDFEQRVNEIYEGDNLVVFQAKEISQGFELRAYEDLDKSQSQTGGDDLLFTLSVQGRTAELKGAGVNKYYRESWIYEVPAGAEARVQEVHHHNSGVSPFFWWWVLSPGWGSYYTPVAHYNTIYTHRTTYRSSRAYRDQVARNTTFSGNMQSKYGSNFRNSSTSTTATRDNYVRKTESKSGFAEKVAASTKKTGAAPSSQMRTSTPTRSSSFSGSSRTSSSSSSSYGSFRGSSGFGI